MSSPAIIAISGYSASGKTTLAKSLADYYALPLFGSATSARDGGPADPIGDANFADLLDQCRSQLADGATAIIDTDLGSIGFWQQLREVCRLSGAKLVPIFLQGEPEILAVRAGRGQGENGDSEHDDTECVNYSDGMPCNPYCSGTACREAALEELMVKLRSQADFLSSLDFPYFRVNAGEDPDSVFSQAATIIDTSLEMWEPISCGPEDEA